MEKVVDIYVNLTPSPPPPFPHLKNGGMMVRAPYKNFYKCFVSQLIFFHRDHSNLVVKMWGNGGKVWRRLYYLHVSKPDPIRMN
jgi:hypothetical protein